ncbi:MAG: FMN-binding negative transcriptional regulator [Caldimonas sp.]
MYQPAHFAETRPEVLQRLIREHPFGLLVTEGPNGLDANGVPFVLDPGAGPGVLRAHVARANPVWKDARTDRESLVVFQGAQTYVSPAWYASKAEHGKVVPTWNYIMVQARGIVRFVDDAAWLHAFVSRLTDRHEAARVAGDANSAAWAVADAPGDYVEGMLRAIVGVEIELSSLVGKWKVSQNRSSADREGVARALSQTSGDDAAAMAREVRDPGTAT